MLLIAAGFASVLSVSQMAQAPTAAVQFAAPRDHVFQSPYALALADFNRDGKQDIAVVNVYHQSVTVVLNGGGTQVVAVGAVPRGLAIGDFNGDLRADLAVTNSGEDTVSVVLGNGNGTFQPALNVVSGVQPWSVVVADFDRDGRHDLAVANRSSNNLSMLLGNGDGTFQPELSVPLGGAPAALAAGDFNNDLRADIAVGVGANTITVLRGTGLGTFLPALDTTLNATWLSDFATGDFNRDGRLDLAAGDPYGDRLYLLPGDGAGTFAAPTMVNGEYRFHSVIAGDFNKDSNLDLVTGGWWPCGCDRTGAQVFIGNGDGTFRPASLVVASGDVYSVAAGDLDGDTNLDLVTASLRTGGAIRPSGTPFPLGTVSVRFGMGDGTFVQTTGSGGYVQQPRSADFNSDGKADIAAVVRSASSCGIAVSLSRGDGTFQVLPTMPYPPDSCGFFSVGDFNGDSRPDLAVASVAGVVALLGNGDGTFTTGPTSGSELETLPLNTGDIDNDGLLDLAYRTADATGNQRIHVQTGNGDGSFDAPTDVGWTSQYNLFGFDLADVTGDGRLDLALITGAPAPLSLMAGNGTGTFQPPIDYVTGLDARDRPVAIAVGDVNGDGGADIVVGNGRSGSLSLLLADGQGSLLPAAIYYTPYVPKAIAVADVNRDDIPDLLVVDSNTLSVLLGQGDGTVSLQPTGFSTLENSSTLIVADFASDGAADVILDSGNGPNGLALLVNVTPSTGP